VDHRAGLVGCGKSGTPTTGFDPRTVHPVARSLYFLSYPGLIEIHVGL